MAEAVRATLDSGQFTDEVRADEMLARQLGISGVPFFVIDRRYGVSGAQGVDVLVWPHCSGAHQRAGAEQLA